MCIYVDNKGNKYKGKLRICEICGDKKIVRITVKTNICRQCRAKDRKNTPKTYIVQGGKKRGAERRICSKCGTIRLVRKDTSCETGLCNSCRSSEWGKINGPIYGPTRKTTGIGSYRKDALAHFKEKCLCCKKTGIQVKIIIHHVDGDRKNNSIFNLIPLCKSCHRRLHDKTRMGIAHEEAIRMITNEKLKKDSK